RAARGEGEPGDRARPPRRAARGPAPRRQGDRARPSRGRGRELRRARERAAHRPARLAMADPGAVVLLLLVGLALALAWALRRRGSGARWDWPRAIGWRKPESSLRVLASSRLDARASVHVLEWEGSRLLVARGEQAVTLLAERP